MMQGGWSIKGYTRRRCEGDTTGHRRRKGRMLGEFTKVVSCHHKAATRLLRRGCVNSGGRGDMGSVGVELAYLPAPLACVSI